MRRLVVFLALTCLIAGVVGVVVPAHAGSAVGNFEIDGNLIDDPPGEPIDWSAVPPSPSDFSDASGSDDDAFGGGSKNNQPPTWQCTPNSSPNKVDIESGRIFFRKLPTGQNGALEQYVYVNYTRAENNGDSHMDYEFNQSSTPNPNCPELPARTDGDVVLTFDTKRGGAEIIVGAFEWDGNATAGTFIPLSVGVQGTTWDGAVNIPNSIPDHQPGDFGEAVLNLTRTIGEIGCGDFASTYMKTRSSTSINSALQDRTTTRPVDVGECPDSNLVKDVRNATNNESFDGDGETNAKPGDSLEYQLTYTNDGNTEATGVVVTDDVDTTFQSIGTCTPSCTNTNGTLTWDLGTQQPGATVVLKFTVTLASSFPVGTTHIFNTGSVESNEETPEDSNTTDVTVNATVIITSQKFASQQSANVGDVITYTIRLSNAGNQAGTTNVIDDYDENHLTIGPISDGGQNNQPTAGKIQWTNISVPAGGTRDLTYSATVKGPFTGPPGGDPCTNTQFPVVNSVTLSNGSGSNFTLCVNGQAVITAVKTVTPATANEGDTVTYQIKLSNSGNIPGTITVTDDYDEAHLTIGTISDGGQNNQPVPGKIQWTNITVPVGSDSKILTYTATVKVGSFSGTPGGSPCTDTQFPVINQVTLSSGGGANVTLCVNGHADITVAKSVDPTSANVGDTVTYTITLTNTGNIPGTITVIDDYDENHIIVSQISDGGQNNQPVPGKIRWSDIIVPVGTRALTYKGTITGTFSGPPGPDCQPGQFPVVNHVTITGGGFDDNTLCVNAEPDLHVVKSADKTQITAGDTITYTLAYSNDGDAEATNVVITETVPTGTSYVSCTGGCDDDNLPTVTWNIGTVPAGGGGSVTMTVTVTTLTACEICNVANIASTEVIAGVSSNELCVGTTPSPNPAGAHATGNATGANVFSSLLGLDLTLAEGNDGAGDHTSVDSSQSGVGSSSEQNELLAVDIPPPAPGSVLHADVLRSVSTSTVTALPARADGTSAGSAANVNILNGTVTATLVRGVATAEATGSSVNVNSLGSAIEGLKVLGIPQAVFPGKRVDLPPAIFGAGSYVAIYEEIKSTSTPAGTSGGTYIGDITVNMIRVHVTNMLVVGPVEVVVGHATAHADFPQTTVCDEQVTQSVSGDAFMAQVLTDPSILPVLVGGLEILPSGGQAANSVNQIVVDPLVTSKAATSSVDGSFSPLNSTSTSSAEVKFLCLLDTPTGCTISARAVRAQANSTATSLNRTSDSVGTEFVALKIGPQTISLPVPANTVIALPGIGFVILNEQFCDNGGTLASNCSNGTVPGHTGITVRAVHLVLLDPAAGGTPGMDVIVAEAHSDALFV